MGDKLFSGNHKPSRSLCTVLQYYMITNVLYDWDVFQSLAYSTVIAYIEVWDFLPQKILQNSYFVTSRQYWLGIAKPKNVFRSTINPSTKLI